MRADAAEDLVVAVDCSTTAAKAVVVDVRGEVMASATRPLRTLQPHPGWHEQDAEQWWTATRDAVRDAVSRLEDAGRVRAMCVTHQRESFVCLDDDGRPLRPAILWLDARAHAEIARFGSRRVHELSGKPPDTTPAIYKLAWLARHEPATLSRARHVGDVHAYLVWRLTGRWATSDASADTLGLFDLRRKTWAPELLSLAGLDVRQLPTLVPTGDAVGSVLPSVAGELGVPPQTAVVAGIGDGQAAALALEATSPGVAYLNLGTSMVLGVQSTDYRWGRGFRTLAGVLPGTFTLETVLNAAAYVATWCREQFGGSVPGTGDGGALEREAALLPPGAEGLLTLPYWNAAQTPHWDPLARGAVVGWHGRHGRAHLYRSILEGVGYELRLHLEGVEAATGRQVDSIRVVGGGARSGLWLRLLADITQRPLRVHAGAEASAAGAGALASRWLCARQDGGRPPPAAVGDVREVRPDPSVAPCYDALHGVYRTMYPSLQDVFAALAAAGTASGGHQPGPEVEVQGDQL